MYNMEFWGGEIPVPPRMQPCQDLVAQTSPSYAKREREREGLVNEPISVCSIGMYITSRIPNRNALHDDNNKCACLLFSVRSRSAEEIQNCCNGGH